MKLLDNILDRYYKGETSLEEEKKIKSLFLLNKTDSAEKDMFAYFDKGINVPDNLEETIFEGILKQQNKKKSFRIKVLTISSAAALIFVLLSVFLNFRSNKNLKMESDFFVMEQALYQVSKNLQPDVSEDMLVLWIDDNVEIIIN